jgi:hypothetical protein
VLENLPLKQYWCAVENLPLTTVLQIDLIKEPWKIYILLPKNNIGVLWNILFDANKFTYKPRSYMKK